MQEYPAGTYGQQQVFAVVVDGQNEYIGGDFEKVGNILSSNVAHWDGTQWKSMDGGVNDVVKTMVMYNGSLYIGGNFTQVGPSSSPSYFQYLARWDSGLSKWKSIMTGKPVGFYRDIRDYEQVIEAPVNELAVNGSDLYISGSFDNIYPILYQSLTVNRIVKWDGNETWTALGTGTTSGIIYTIAFLGTDVYVGGEFSSMGGVTAKNIAKWDGTTWSALGSGLNGSVNAIACIGTDVYVGGEFTSAGGITVNRIAKWDGTSWSALVDGLDSSVWSIAFNGTDMYVGGDFNYAGSVHVRRIARFDGSSWHAMSSSMDGLFGTVNAIAADGNKIVAGGNFSNVLKDYGAGISLGIAVNNIAFWNGTEWEALGDGFGSRVRALALKDGNLKVGGIFLNSGSETAKYYASFYNLIAQETVPNAVIQLSPSANQLEVSSSPTLSWNSVSNATSYTLQVATEQTFSSFLVNAQNLVDTTYALSSLSDSTWYYWRLKAVNAIGESDWSDTLSFKTVSVATLNEGLQLTGTSGWRMMSSPVHNSTFQDLFGSLWTQGFPGSDADAAGSNQSSIYLFDGTAFTPPTNQNNTIAAGTGFIAYVYEDDDNTIGGIQGGFPKTINFSGSEHASPVNVSVSSGTGTFSLMGNPFASTIDWDVVQSTSTNVHGTVYVYDPTYTATQDDGSGASQAIGAYRVWNGTIGGLANGLIAPYQGFWIESTNTSAVVSFTNASKTSGGTFHGKVAKPEFVKLIVEKSSGETNEAYIQFSENATTDYDEKDAWKIRPLTTNYLLLMSGFINGKGLDINNLPLVEGEIEIPIGLETSLKGHYSLKIENQLSNSSTIRLLDTQTGISTVFSNEQSYEFEINTVEKAKPVSDNQNPVFVTSSEIPRFKLYVSHDITTSNETNEKVFEFSLAQNFPNPFNPTTTLSYSVPSLSNVELTIFDMLGREVAVLVNEQKQAGNYEINFDASRLSSGIYLYRLQANGLTITRKMTLIK